MTAGWSRFRPRRSARRSRARTSTTCSRSPQSGSSGLRAAQDEAVAPDRGRRAAGASLVLATRNPHKLREFERLLAPAGVVVEPLPDEVELPPEDGETFAENAVPKARAAAAATGRAAIADDSGIEAAALDGAPGSARRGSPARCHRRGEPGQADRSGAGRKWAAIRLRAGVRRPGRGVARLFEGDCDGHMAEARRGEGGFGYDPVFVPEGEPTRTHDGRAVGRREGFDQPSGASGAGARGLAPEREPEP